jgi:hypothetical protein
MNKEALRKLALLLIQGTSDAELVAEQVDILIQWRNISWLPRPIARWLERNDDGMLVEVSKLLLDLRDELVAAGAMVLVKE